MEKNKKYVITKLMYRDKKVRNAVSNCVYDNRDEAVEQLKVWYINNYEEIYLGANANHLPIEIYAWNTYQVLIEEYDSWDKLREDGSLNGDWVGRKVN